MPKRHENETVVGQWTVPAADHRAFVRAVRAHAERNPGLGVGLKFPDEPPAAQTVDVVVRDDAIFVGDQSCHIAPWHWPAHADHDGWVELRGEDDGYGYFIPLPVPPHARAAAARVAQHFAAARAEHDRKAAEAEANPTTFRKFERGCERHFVLLLLLFFFVLLPGGIYLLVQLFPSLGK